MILSFLIGGLICLLIQLLIDLTKLTPARILVLLVATGVFIQGVGLYPLLFDLCGAGVSVPLLGFGASIAKGTAEVISSDGFMGILKGPFSSAAIGCSAALSLGFIFSLFSKGKPKKCFKKRKKL
jgi:stage V sporulation protein AE